MSKESITIERAVFGEKVIGDHTHYLYEIFQGKLKTDIKIALFYRGNERLPESMEELDEDEGIELSYEKLLESFRENLSYSQ